MYLAVLRVFKQYTCSGFYGRNNIPIPVHGYEDQQPGRHVSAEEEEEGENSASGIGNMKQLRIKHSPNPGIETPRIERTRIRTCQYHQVEMNCGRSHALSRQYHYCEGIAHRAHRYDDGQPVYKQTSPR